MFDITFYHVYIILRISAEHFGVYSVVLWISLYLSCKALYDYFSNMEESLKNKEFLTYGLVVIAICLATVYHYYTKYNLDNPLVVEQWKLYFQAKALLGL